MPTIVKQLADTRAFILARLEPKPDGSTDKVPTDPTTGYNLNAQAASAWITGAEAEYYASAWNASLTARKAAGETLSTIEYGVGLMIADGRFFIDLDHCRDASGGWQPHALAFVSRFPGASVEVSASLEGLHILGMTTDTPLHGTRNKTYRMEAYSKERFCYTTGLGAYGDINTDCTEPLKRFLADFFPAHEHGSAEWTSGPNVAWSGPADDNELIARALRSSSGKAFMKQAASFRDLWMGDIGTLARFYPPQMTGKSINASAADQALANQLAFWTGNDCERMNRLMNMSGLRRDKWQRADYLKSTIMLACGDAREWYSESKGAASASVETPQQSVVTAVTVDLTGSAAPIPPPFDATSPAPPPPSPSAPGPTYSLANLPAPGEYVNVHMQKQIFDGMCYVRDIHKVQLPDGTAWKESQFNVTLGHRKWAIEPDGSKPGTAWEAFTDSQIAEFPQVVTQYFGPRDPLGNIRDFEGQREINNYRAATIRRVKGDVTPFLTFARTLLPVGNDLEILLYWMAAAVQNLGVKFNWWPFLQGTKGNGKTTLGKILEYCFSHRYTHWPKPSELNEKFNSVFVEKLMLIVDETRTQDQTELQEILKIMVTTTRLEVRAMYVEKVMKAVCFNGLLISNHKNGVRIDKDERRFAPFYCAQQEKEHNARDGLTNEFFVRRLIPWLAADGNAIVFDYLSSLEIPDEYNPATLCVIAPDTSSTAEAITASLGSVEQELMSAIEKRELGFRNGWIRDVEVDHLLARVGKDKSIPRNQRKSLILALGYVSHPSLPDGLCAVAWSDGHTPRMYIKKGHPWAVDHLSAEQVRDGYTAAQKI